MKRKFHKGTTMWIYATWLDQEGNPLLGIGDHEITIKDPTGTDQPATINVTEAGGGRYYFRFDIPIDAVAGEWYIKWKIYYAGNVGIEEFRFEVE